MLKLKYSLESEKKYNQIDEKEHDKRQVLSRVQKVIEKGVEHGKNKGKVLLNEQQVVLKQYFEEDILSNTKISSYQTMYNQIMPIFYLGLGIRKPYSLIVENELRRYISQLRVEGKSKGTICSYSFVIKKFFKWLYKVKGKGEYPEIVSWIPNTKQPARKIDEKDLITHEEIKAMMECSDNMEACFIGLLYEFGARISEVLGIKLRDINWNDDGTEAKIKVSGKTGERTLILIDNIPVLKQWLKQHSYRSNPDSPLFINRGKQFGRQLKATGGWFIIKRCKNRAGINKKVYPHLFRHSRLHYLSKYYGFNEMQLRYFAGWTKTSEMPSVYLHYGMENVYDKIRDIKGKTENTLEQQRLQQESILRNIKCSKCNSINPSTNIECEQCQTLFETAKRQQADNQLNDLFQDREFQQLVKGFLKKKNLQN